MKTFKDIGGYAIQKNEANKIVDFIKNYDFYISNGARLPRGILFYGDPGTGKTLLADAIANEAGVRTYMLGSDELTEEKNQAAVVRQTFREAKKSKPSIIIIDEIEKLVGTSNYGSLPSSERETDSLRALLTEIDHDTEKSVLVIATSNVPPHRLPYALIREGRIEKHMVMPYPDAPEREEILRMYMSKNAVFENVDPHDIAVYSGGMTGAAIEHLVNEVLIACLSARKKAEFRDFLDPIESIRSSSVKTKEKLRPEVIYHEVGHFIADYVLNGSIGMINVESYGEIAGRYSSLDIDFDDCWGDDVIVSKKFAKDDASMSCMKNKCVICVSGIAADEIYMNEIYAGSSSDLHQFAEIFNTMMASGMLGSEAAAAHHATHQSEHYYEVSFKLFKKLYDESITKAREIMKANRALAEALYNALLETPVLTHTDIQKIIDSVNSETGENKNPEEK